jgi:hypothetical protein
VVHGVSSINSMPQSRRCFMAQSQGLARRTL